MLSVNQPTGRLLQQTEARRNAKVLEQKRSRRVAAFQRRRRAVGLLGRRRIVAGQRRGPAVRDGPRARVPQSPRQNPRQLQRKFRRHRISASRPA
jgi:hypothetical protein